MAKIAKIDLKSQSYSNDLLLRLTVIVNSIADRLNEGELERAHRILKRTEERVAKLEDIMRGYNTRGPGS